MSLFDLGRLLHSAVGIVALAAFWVAAVASKGGPLHRRAGRIYLAALIGVMSLSTLMAGGKALEGDPQLALFLAFLISLVGAASWLMWYSVGGRRRPEQLTGGVYRALAAWLIVAGAGLFWLGVTRRHALIMFLSLLGAGFGANMWRLARVPVRDRDGRFRLAQHMNGAMLNFIATHDSFLALGVGSVVPELRHGVPRMLIAVGLTVAGLSIRTALARRDRPGRFRVEKAV